MVALTGTRARGSALSRESSLSAMKRLKRACQSSSWRRASATAAASVAHTPQRAPKHGKVW